jgi:PAS domain S-box-containing protein
VADFTYDWEYWLGPGGELIYISPSCERMTGHKADEFKKAPDLLETIIHPDDRALVVKHLHAELSSRDVLSYRFRIIHKNGEERWIAHICQQVFGKDGSLLGRRASNRDITDQIKTEKASFENQARYREMIEHTVNGVAVYEAHKGGEDFVFVDFNRSCERIEKIRREEVIGRSVLEVFPGIKDFGLFDVLKRVWKTGQSEHFPVSQYRDNRIVGWRDNYVYKLPSGEVVAVYSDVTERKQAEEALQKAHDELYRFSKDLEKIVEERTVELQEKNRELLQADKLAALGKMANRVAHDLRNSLTVVGGFARRLDEKTTEDDPKKRYVKIIVREVKVLEDKISQIIKVENE